MALYDQNIYNPIQPNSLYPYYQPVNTMVQQVQRYDIIKVNGRNGANALTMAPNSSVLLLDINDPIVWFVSTDGAGYKTCIPYSISPYKAADNESIEELISKINMRLDNIEERIKGHESDRTGIKSTAETKEWNI